MTSAPETKPASLKETFAKVAVSIVGLTVAMAVPVYHLIAKDNGFDPLLVGGVIGLGSSLFVSPTIGQKGGTLKDSFTKLNRVIPTVLIGVLLGTLGALTENAVVTESAQREADLKAATLLSPDEIISEKAADRFCVKRNEPYNQIVTLAGQKRFIPCGILKKD